MNQKTLSVLFYLNKSKMNSKGVCPIKCRITYDKKRKEFSTGEFINPMEWSANKQNASYNSIANQQINLQLEIISIKLKKAYLQLQMLDDDFGVDEILAKYAGKVERREEHVISYFEQYLTKQSKLIGKDFKLSTWKKSEYVYRDVKAFISSNYGKKDYPLEKLSQSFLDAFEYYLKTVKNQRQITVNKAIQRFRKTIKAAMTEGFLEKDPFAMHKPGRVIKEVIFLSTDELRLLEEHHFKEDRLQLVNDLFIFCCYTGLAYHEMANLKKEHIIKGFDGNEWIQMKREKTGRMLSVPLMPQAKAILAKYQSAGPSALPKFSNQKINAYLKEIAEKVGIHKSISHHMARKTFASTVLLYNDVPIEIVSELLGHSSIKITQDYYGKVVQKRVSQEIFRLMRK